MYRGCKLFLSEDGFEVVRVDCGIASIPPFRIDIPSSSESIWFCAETTRTEPDDKIELGKVLGDEQEWITILFGDTVETAEVDTKAQ